MDEPVRFSDGARELIEEGFSRANSRPSEDDLSGGQSKFFHDLLKRRRHRELSGTTQGRRKLEKSARSEENVRRREEREIERQQKLGRLVYKSNRNARLFSPRLDVERYIPGSELSRVKKLGRN